MIFQSDSQCKRPLEIDVGCKQPRVKITTAFHDSKRKGIVYCGLARSARARGHAHTHTRARARGWVLYRQGDVKRSWGSTGCGKCCMPSCLPLLMMASLLQKEGAAMLKPPPAGSRRAIPGNWSPCGLRLNCKESRSSRKP